MQHDYVIRGGIEGRERLRILSRVMHPTTSMLLDRIEIAPGMQCLDVGCGGGDVTFELARRVAPGGRAVGVDIDAVKLGIAREEAELQGLANIEFHQIDVRDTAVDTRFDVVYTRFVLTHLNDPSRALAAMGGHLRPGGVLVIEDIDESGHFVYPESHAFSRYRDLYCQIVERRGADPNIGPKLPLMLKHAGVRDVHVSVVQPVGLQGEMKLLNALTMENIADTVLGEGLATREEIDDLVRELYEYAAHPETLAGVPRVVQAWGRL